MPRFTFFLVPGLACLLTIGVCSAVEKPAAAKAEPAAQSVEQIAATARKSVVVITFAGRDGKQQGLGTGFVVDADGLIATNLHVLGQARQITVETADGKQHEVTSIHASDRSLDLALVRINVKGLTPLPVGDSDRLKEGQPVVSWSRMLILPWRGGVRPIRLRKVVVLPAPLRPRMVTTSPTPSSKPTPCRMWLLP